jgi:glyoxylase-like metal-dependent hydrolase (beta-lactamase superfamily II)
LKVLKITYPPLFVNTYILCDGHNNAIIIDPGGEYARLSELKNKEKLKYKAVFITHCHFDHVIGVPEIKKNIDIPIYLPEKDLFLYKSARDFAKSFLGIELDEFPDPEYLLKGGEIIKIGKFEIKVYKVPGHTPGHMLYEIDKKVFCGDLIFAGSVGRTDFPESSYEDMEKSLKFVVENFPASTELFPGHGPSTTLKQEKKENPFLIKF